MDTEQSGLEITSNNGELPSNCEISDSSVLAEIHKRVNFNHLRGVDEVATASLAWYFYTLAAAEREVRALLTRNEVLLVCDTLTSTYLGGTAIIEGLQWCIEDSLHYAGYAEKWDVDADILIAKMYRLSRLQKCALLDMVERIYSLEDEDGESIERFLSEEPRFESSL